MAEVITGRGINQADLISLLTLIRTNFVGVTAKLDLDGGVTDTDFASVENYTLPTSIGPVGIFSQGSVLDYLKTVRTKYNALLVKLDADGTVTDTDYSSIGIMAAVIDSASLGSLQQAGVYEGALVKWLDTYIGKWNATLTKLDTDGAVSGTNFNSLWAIPATRVDATGCVNKP